jgi:hypothetical protein
MRLVNLDAMKSASLPFGFAVVIEVIFHRQHRVGEEGDSNKRY